MADTPRNPSNDPLSAPSEPVIERSTSPTKAAAEEGAGAGEVGPRAEGDGAGAYAPGRNIGSRKRRAKFAVGGLVIVLAIAGLVVWAMTRSESTAFFMTVSEVAAGPPAGSPESFRVNGNVVPDTVERNGVETSFDITDGAADLTVVTDDALPDAFWSAYENDASNIEVIAQGSLDTDGSTFTASKVLAKCPSKFKTRA